MSDHAKENAAGWMQTITEYMDGMEQLEDGAESVTVDGEEYTDSDSLRERIEEFPLSVEVRNGWHTPGSDSEAEEYCVLISTGGPALRIYGEMGPHNEPQYAVLQYQDWGTPWTDYGTDSEQDDALLAFAHYFYFGE